LANRALLNAGAHGASHYGEVTPDADYVWGSPVSLGALQPGDIVQFRDYRFQRTVETSNSDGSGSTATTIQERPHHTAVVEHVDGGGAVTVLEQNSPEGSPVVRTQLFFTAGTTTSGNRMMNTAVEGKFWFYRPQLR